VPTSADHAATAEVCPGCGGRNVEHRTTCDWCGLPLVDPPRGRRRALLAFALLAVLLLGGLAWALLTQGALPQP
jgi:hypothetical protein